MQSIKVVSMDPGLCLNTQGPTHNVSFTLKNLTSNARSARVIFVESSRDTPNFSEELFNIGANSERVISHAYLSEETVKFIYVIPDEGESDMRAFTLPQCDPGKISVWAEYGLCVGEDRAIIYHVTSLFNTEGSFFFYPGQDGAVMGDNRKVFSPANPQQKFVARYTRKDRFQTITVSGIDIGGRVQLVINEIPNCTCDNLTSVGFKIGGQCEDGIRRNVSITGSFGGNGRISSLLQINPDDPSTIQPKVFVSTGSLLFQFEELSIGQHTMKLIPLAKGCPEQVFSFIVPPCGDAPPLDCDQIIIGTNITGDCDAGKPIVELSVANLGSDVIIGRWVFGDSTPDSNLISVPSNGTPSIDHAYAPGTYVAKFVAGNCQKSTLIIVTEGLCEVCSQPEIVDVLLEQLECLDGKRKIRLTPILEAGSGTPTKFTWTINNNNATRKVIVPQAGIPFTGAYELLVDAPGSGSSAIDVSVLVNSGECFSLWSDEMMVEGCDGDCVKVSDINIVLGDCNADNKRPVTFELNPEPVGRRIQWSIFDDAGAQVESPTENDPTLSVFLPAGDYKITSLVQEIAGCPEQVIERNFSVQACKTDTPEKTSCGFGLIWAAVISFIIGVSLIAIAPCLGAASTTVAVAGWIAVAAYSILMLIYLIARYFSDCPNSWCKVAQIHLAAAGILGLILLILGIAFSSCFDTIASHLFAGFTALTASMATGCIDE